MNDYVFMYIFKLLGFNCFRLVYLIFYLMNCDNSLIMQCACTFTETTTRERESSVTKKATKNNNPSSQRPFNKPTHIVVF